MKLPQAPPGPVQGLIADLMQDPAAWQRVIDQGLYLQTTSNGKYVHWDKLRRLEAPEGLTHEQWWAVLKLARIPGLKPFSMTDKHGAPFVVGTPEPLLRRTSEIDRDLRGWAHLPEELADASARDQFMVSALIEEAITSSQLEGASTTTAVAKDMLRKKRAPRDRSEQMIANNFAAMELVREVAHLPLSPALVCAIHESVTEGTLEDEGHAGVLRSSDDVVVQEGNTVLHRPPKAAELERRMRAMCDFANEKKPKQYLHPAVRAALLHFWLAYDHPFQDGNGRTARALCYWSFLHSGYELFQFVSISQILKRAPARYARAYLHSETDGNDATYFVLHQLDVIQKGILALHEYLRTKARSQERTRSLLRESVDFNHRQLALLTNALANPDARYTVRSHSNSHRVTRQTARTDLAKLVAQGLLQEVRVGRRRIYSPVPDLDNRVSGR